MSESDDSKLDILGSALGMLVIGAIIAAIGGWCVLLIVASFQLAYRPGNAVAAVLVYGVGVVAGLGCGFWLVYCGLRAIVRLLLGKRNP